jgi:hypothetical protein
MRPNVWKYDYGDEHDKVLQTFPEKGQLYAYPSKLKDEKPSVNDNRDLTEDEGESSPRRKTLCEKVGKSLKNCFRKKKNSGGTRRRRSKRSRK